MKILIVDDDKNTCEVIAQLLELNGHSCTISNDGKSALGLIQNNGFDRIVLDMSMPKFSGEDFLKELTKTGLNQKTKVVVYTAMPFYNDEINSLLKIKATAFVYKNKGFGELLKTLESI